MKARKLCESHFEILGCMEIGKQIHLVCIYKKKPFENQNLFTSTYCTWYISKALVSLESPDNTFILQ